MAVTDHNSKHAEDIPFKCDQGGVYYVSTSHQYACGLFSQSLRLASPDMPPAFPLRHAPAIVRNVHLELSLQK